MGQGGCGTVTVGLWGYKAVRLWGPETMQL